MKKLPPETFDFYFSLGPARSYQAVAEHYKLSKRSVTSLAKREDWQGRIAELERKARESSDKKKLETLDEMNERHLKQLRFLAGKAIEGLKSMQLDNQGAVVRALQLAICQERTICGEPSERTAVSIEDTIKREYERWMVKLEPDSPNAEEPDAGGESTPEEEDDAGADGAR